MSKTKRPRNDALFFIKKSFGEISKNPLVKAIIDRNINDGAIASLGEVWPGSKHEYVLGQQISAGTTYSCGNLGIHSDGKP